MGSVNLHHSAFEYMSTVEKRKKKEANESKRSECVLTENTAHLCNVFKLTWPRQRHHSSDESEGNTG